MSQEEEKDTHSSYDKRDPITLFMLGGKRNESIEENNKPQQTKEIDWLFGKKEANYNEDRSGNTEFGQNTKINEILNNIDLEELMKNMDTLMDTAVQFKPLWKKVSPHITKWMNKE